jgi:5-methylcytosine-specific restriction endonuclease McrA
MAKCLHCGADVPIGLGRLKNKIRKFCSTKCIKSNWTARNRDSVYAKQKQRNLENPEARAQASRKYYLKNKAYYAEYASLRNRSVKQATPSWADTNEIHNVYLEAQYMQMEVDHIIPLKHPLVCGLHVWDNLQLLSRSDNARKNNNFDSDILAVIE